MSYSRPSYAPGAQYYSQQAYSPSDGRRYPTIQPSGSSSSQTYYPQQQQQQQQQQQPPPPPAPIYSSSFPKRPPPQQQQKPRISFFCLHKPCDANCVAFARKADLTRHVDILHGRPSLALHDCRVPGCRRVGPQGFTRKDKMVDHMREVHKLDIPKKQPGRPRSVGWGDREEEEEEDDQE